MRVELSKQVVESIKSAARKLTGHERRQFQAESALEYCGGNPRQAERVFGWVRDTVNTGLHELRTGIRCFDSFSVRGRHKTEEKYPEIAQQIHALVEPESQADPKFQTPLAYTRMTAKAVREQLTAKAKTDGTEPHVPPERSLYRILNRLGYRLRRVRKTKPKKIPETDAIFDHLRRVHTQATRESETLRISLDTKAKVKVGPFSRGGVSRGPKAVQAADHDMHPDAVLAPAGILEVDSDQLNVIFGTSRDTSDFVADAIELWWSNRGVFYPGVRRLLIDLDNGPEIASGRTQFMKRLVEFSDRHQLALELAYYPPYHSKYNLIERCWGILENHWNGALLTSVETALAWAQTMTWRGVSPIVHLLKGIYETGVRVSRAAFRPINARLQRSVTLPKWSLIINPNIG